MATSREFASLVAQLVKNPPAMWKTWVGKIPWRMERLPAPVFWPGEFFFFFFWPGELYGLYCPGSPKELDTSE